MTTRDHAELRDQRPHGQFLPDSPITEPELDRFGRWPFAARIADIVATRRDTSALAVGLFGEWGEGKTSVLHLIDHQLRSAHDDRTVPIFFNPWRYGTEDELLLSFYSQLAKALERSLKGKLELVRGFFEKLAKFGGVALDPSEKASALLRDLKGSLEQDKANLEQILGDAKKRVVVLVDDVDRLEKTEIQALFRLVKLSADLKNVVYVLALDEEIVAQALGERYGGDSLAGRRFLEKIIQVPMRIPAVTPGSMDGYCNEELDTVLEECGVELTHNHMADFGHGFSTGIRPSLRTPRLVKRYVNALRFSLVLLRGEIDVVDLLLAEGVRVVYPELYLAIRDDPGLFLGHKRVSGIGGGDARERFLKRQRSVFSRALKGRPRRERTAAHRLLEALFPRFGGNVEHGAEWDVVWRRRRKIAHADYLSRWLFYSVPPGDIPDRSVEAFLELAQSSPLNTVVPALRELLANDADTVFPKLSDQLEKSPSQLAEKLVLALGGTSSQFPADHGSFGLAHRIAIFAVDLSKRIEPDRRLQVAQELLTQSESLIFAAHYFNYLRSSDDEARPRPGLFAAHEEAALGARLALRIQEHFATHGGLLYLPSIEKSSFVQWIWQRWGDRVELSNHLTRTLRTHPGEAIKLLRQHIPQWRDLSRGYLGRDRLSPSHLLKVAELIDLETIDRALQAAAPRDYARACAGPAELGDEEEHEEHEQSNSDAALVGAFASIMAASRALAGLFQLLTFISQTGAR